MTETTDTISLKDLCNLFNMSSWTSKTQPCEYCWLYDTCTIEKIMVEPEKYGREEFDNAEGVLAEKLGTALTRQPIETTVVIAKTLISRGYGEESIEVGHRQSPSHYEAERNGRRVVVRVGTIPNVAFMAPWYYHPYASLEGRGKYDESWYYINDEVYIFKRGPQTKEFVPYLKETTSFNQCYDWKCRHCERTNRNCNTENSLQFRLLGWPMEIKQMSNERIPERVPSTVNTLISPKPMKYRARTRSDESERPKDFLAMGISAGRNKWSWNRQSKESKVEVSTAFISPLRPRSRRERRKDLVQLPNGIRVTPERLDWYLEVLTYLQEPIRSERYAEALGVMRQTASNYLRQFTAMGKLRVIGTVEKQRLYVIRNGMK